LQARRSIRLVPGRLRRHVCAADRWLVLRGHGFLRRDGGVQRLFRCHRPIFEESYPML
jgi:hypothetical protein